MRLTTLRPIAILFILSILALTHGATGAGKGPQAFDGRIDFRNWDFGRDGPAPLSGEWEFYWDTAASPCELPSLAAEGKAAFVRVPHRWRLTALGNRPLNPQGIATYRLRVFCNPPNSPLSLKLSFWPCSYKLWINGKLASEEGDIGRGPKKNTCVWRSRLVPMETAAPGSEIVLAMGGSLFSQFSGFSPAITIGPSEQLRKNWGIDIGIKAILAAWFIFFLIIGLLFFLLGGKRQLGYVYLGLFDLTIIVPFLILKGNDIAFLFPKIPLTFYIPLVVNDWNSFIFLFLFLRSFFPNETPKIVLTGVLAFFGIFALLVIFVPGFLFSDLFYISDLVLFLSYDLILAGIMIFAVARKRNNSVLVLSGVVIFMLIALIAQYTVAYAPDPPTLFYLIYLGLFMLIGAQLLTIARDFSRSQREATLRREQLGHAEKLATLGTVVASVAHEVNNPNNSILLDAQTQRKALEALLPRLDETAKEEGDFEVCGCGWGEFKGELVKASERVIRNSQRISRIVSDLRALSKKDVDMKETVDINAVVSSAVQVIDYVIRKSTRNFRIDYGTGIPPLKGNHHYLEQVVINLVKNACQSLQDMEKGVFIATSYEQSSRQALFLVRDEGRGIRTETLQTIFVPFYSTRGKEGTGLGLSICNSIVKAHGGRLEVTSEVGKGTSVKVYLPVSV
jgi:signal transduction histidine kinase